MPDIFEDKDELIKRYLAEKLGGAQSGEELESMRSKDNQNIQLQRDAASATLAEGLNNASALMSGGRYKADNSDLIQSNKDRQATINSNTAQVSQGKQLAQKDRQSAISEYLAGKKQKENDEFRNKAHDATVAHQKFMEDQSVKNSEAQQNFRERELDLKTQLAEAKAAGGKSAHRVPAQIASEIGSYRGMDDMIDNLGGKFDSLAASKTGWEKAGSIAAGFLPGNESDEEKYNQELRRAAQAIGTVLEKGKLTDADYVAKYVPMMPKFYDSPENKAAKLRGLKEYARTKQEAEVQGLTEGGYDTSGFSKLPALPPQVAEKKKKDGSAYAATSPNAPAIPAGKIKVSNGSESHYIDPADEQEAAAEGFKRVP